MQVFNTFFKILKKQLASILIYAVIFFVITLLITSSQSKKEPGEFEEQKVPIMVLNQDYPNRLMDNFISYLEKYAKFIEPEYDDTVRMDLLIFQKVHYILTIPEGFFEGFLAGEEVSLQKQVLPNAVGTVSIDAAIDNYFNTARTYLKYHPEITPDELSDSIRQNLAKEAKVMIDIDSQDEKVSADIYNSYYFLYLSYIIIVCFISGVSSVMIAFHGVDIRRRHNAAPLSIRSMNIQLVFANFIFVLIYLIIFLLGGYLFNPFRRFDANLLLNWANVLVFSLTVLSISYLIGITLKNRKAISAVATSISLSAAFLGGIFVPQEFLGDAVLKVASFTPVYWYVKANNSILRLTKYEWNQLSEVFGFMVIQIGFAAAIISIALVVSKRKRQQAG